MTENDRDIIQKPRLGFSKMFLIMTTDVRLINSRRCQLVETHHTDRREDQDVHYSLCTLPTDTIYHLVETHHTDSRDQDVHHGLHTLPTVEPCHSLTAVCKARW